MRTFLFITTAAVAMGPLIGAALAGPDAFLSPDGKLTWVHSGQSADADRTLQDPAGCEVIDETYNDSFPPECCLGWTIADTPCYNRAVELVIESDVTGCELMFHFGHVAGTNQYKVALHSDAGGEVGEQIASHLFEAERFGQLNPPLVWDLEGLCLEAGTYWISFNAEGDQYTWGALNLSTMGVVRQGWFDDDCSETYYIDGGIQDPGCLRLTATEGCIGSGLDLTIRGGGCPGSITLGLDGGVPNGRHGYAYSFRTGSWIVPAGPCAGLELGIVSPTVAAIVPSDGTGSSSLRGTLPASACGRLYVQGVDVIQGACAASNVLSL